MNVGDDLISHARRVMNLYPPSDAAMLRLRLKLEGKKKASEQQGDVKQEDSTDQSGTTCDARQGKTPRLPDSSSLVNGGGDHGEQSMDGHCKSRRTAGSVVESFKKGRRVGVTMSLAGKGTRVRPPSNEVG